MAIFQGKLIPSEDNISVANYAIEIRLRSIIKTSDDDKEGLSIPVSGSARALETGNFKIEILTEGDLNGPVNIVVSAPDGTEVEQKEMPLERALKPLNIKIKTIPKYDVQTSNDPTLGQRFRVNGQVIEERGRKIPSGLPIVIWGIPKIDDQEKVPQRPLIISETQSDGIFAGNWVSDELRQAFGIVSGGESIPIPLDETGRLPKQILLVINLDEIDINEDSNESCSCDEAPPRAPDPIDLTTNPAAFSQDLGGGCIDLTVPNRTLEEFTYSFVVRTTEPKVKGVTLGLRKPVPQNLIVDLLGVSIASSAYGSNPARAFSFQSVNLEMDVQAAKSLVRSDRPPTLAEFERAAWLSQVSQTKELIDAGLRSNTSRVVLDADNPIDWDDTPTIYLAIDLAFGHILTYKEIWRADGYSLGDLLYSLPLAPGQRRRIAVVDWERKTSAARDERLEVEEELDAILSRDRDIMEIVGSNLHEETKAGSKNRTWGASGGIGLGFIGSGFGLFGGASGGASGSSSSAWQQSARSFSGNSLQRLRDRVGQRASSVRSQRSTVVQTVAQGETLRAESEVIANYNRCHAVTMEYFEVLRHFLITHELSSVQECLFLPLPITQFNRGKALRWQEPLSDFLKDRRLRGGFGALERIADNWVGWDFPVSRYSEDAPESLEGELRISFLLPRPRDDEDGKFQIDRWRPYAFFLPVSLLELHTAKLNEVSARRRDQIFQNEIAPEIAKNLVQQLKFYYVTADGGEVEITMDPTLVSRYREGRELYVTLRPASKVSPDSDLVVGLPNVPREEISHIKIGYDGPELPPDAKVIVHRGKMRYRTDHITALLFNSSRILDDIRGGDPVVIPTPVSRRELHNPRQKDRELADRLVNHLNENLEFYHQVIWLNLDPQRRYMLLDSVLLPEGDGRSVASVCVNEIIGIVGNSLVLPVAPGQKLDPTVETVTEDGVALDLANVYATPPAPPLRVSVPTRGVYAEAISGECNACEEIDDARYWRWDTTGQLELPGIDTISTATRAQDEPDLTPTSLPNPLVTIQNAPEIPNPVGLSDAFGLLSTPGLFQDITGLEGTQKNAKIAFDAALSAASAIGGEAAKLAKQQELGKNASRMIDRISQAKSDGLLSSAKAEELTVSALKGLIGEDQKKQESPTDDKTVKKVLKDSAQSNKADIKINVADETIEISFEDPKPVVGASVVVGTLDIETTDPLGFVSQDVVLDFLDSSKTPKLLRIPNIPDLENLFKKQNIDILKANKILKPDSLDPNKYTLSRRLRIVYPADPSDKNKVKGTGKLPIVVLVHGQHDIFHNGIIHNHQGYGYLQEMLALQGIVSVSVDMNAANAFGDATLIVMRSEMTLGALDALRILDGNGSRFQDRLDFDNVGLMGHSRGGDAVVHAAKMNSKLSPTQKYGIKAVCALAPTDFAGTVSSTGSWSTRPLESKDTPFFSVVYGGLDGDVSGCGGAKSSGGTGFRHYDRTKTEKAMVYINHCNHNRFNTQWADVNSTLGRVVGDDFGMNPSDLGSGGRLLSPLDHRKLANEYIGGLFLWKLLGQTSHKGLFNGNATNSLGAKVALQWSFGKQIISLDEMETALSSRTLNPAFSGVDLFTSINTGSRNFEKLTFQQTSVFFIEPASLSGPTVMYTLKMPVGQKDWSGFDAFNFRVCKDFDLSSLANINAGNLPEFIIEVVDGNGASAQISSTQLANNLTPSRPVFHEFLQISFSEIKSISVGNPAVITSNLPHGLNTGDDIAIVNNSTAIPNINGIQTITKVSNDSFSIPINVTSIHTLGTLGFFGKFSINNCSGLRFETLSLPLILIENIDPSQIESVNILVPSSVAEHMFFDSLELIEF